MNLPEVFKSYRKLDSNVHALFTVNIINSFGNFVYPFLTFFLARKLGMNSRDSGLIVTLSSLLITVSATFGGKLADRIGRKKTLIISHIGATFFLFLAIFVKQPVFFIIILILSFCFSQCTRPTIAALVADSTNLKERKTAYSLIYLGINIGSAIGPLIAGILFEKLTSLIFVINGLAELISLSIIMLFIREKMTVSVKSSESGCTDKTRKIKEQNTFLVIFQRKQLLFFTLSAIIFSFVYCQHRYSLANQLESIFKDSGALVFSTMMAANAITVILFTIILTAMTAKISMYWTFALAGLFYAAGFGMIYFISNHILFIFSTILWTIGEILFYTNLNAFITYHSPDEYRGRVNGFVTLVIGCGGIFNPYIMGGYIQNFGVRSIWPLTFGLSILGSLMMIQIWRYSMNIGKTMQPGIALANKQVIQEHEKE